MPGLARLPPSSGKPREVVRNTRTRASRLVDPPAAGTGAVMRQEAVHRYAAEAGFARVERLAIDNEFWRFYRLLP